MTTNAISRDHVSHKATEGYHNWVRISGKRYEQDPIQNELQTVLAANAVAIGITFDNVRYRSLGLGSAIRALTNRSEPYYDEY